MKGDFQLGHHSFVPHTAPDLSSIFKNASKSFLALNLPGAATPAPLGPKAPAPKLERRVRHGSLAKGKVEGRNPVRVSVLITSYRVRLLDEDNLCEKYHVDCLRYAGLLSADTPGAAQITTRQQKVGSKAEERTEILISAIPPISSK